MSFKLDYWLLTAMLVLPAYSLADSDITQEPPENKLPLEELHEFTDVFHKIRENYVSEVSDSTLIEYAIKGMLEGLDPHSAYLNRKDFAELQESTSGEFGGLGIEVTMDNGFIKVVSPIDDTPAMKAGIKPGDLIIKIDDKAVKGLNLDDSIDLMRGPKGSKVVLTIIRDESPQPLVITLKRDIIRIKSVKSMLLEEHYAYLRIAQFQTGTTESVKEHLESLIKESVSQIDGLIIDLRNNPGGVLHTAVEISNLFLDHGLIVYTEGRTSESREEFMATSDVLLKDKPIVVLINSGSASASEIVAGALQDHKRAIIAGTTSFGKGSVQIILELPKQRGMKLTTARYYTPLGRSIQAQGIVPDIKIQSAEITLIEDTLDVTEANLSRHLDKEDKKDDAGTDISASDITDYQIFEALNLLKAMQFSYKSMQ